MFNLGEVIALMCFGAVLLMGGVMGGGWLVYKSRNAVPGERLFGGVPKGEVFTMKDEIDSLNDSSDGAEKEVLAKNRIFNAIFGDGETKP
jgi:hypothetical protein